LSSQRSFEVAVYNKEVRRLVGEGRHHRNLSDAWAETHYIDVKADNAQDARMQVARRYPADQGYVVEDAVPLKFAD